MIPKYLQSMLTTALLAGALVGLASAQAPATPPAVPPGGAASDKPADKPADKPTGPLAPTAYKNIQVLTDVPADQLDLTMRYFVAATGLQCQSRRSSGRGARSAARWRCCRRRSTRRSRPANAGAAD